MAKIFATPENIPYPEFNIDRVQAEKNEAEYLAKLKAFCEEHGSGKNRGKEIRFPMADGRARYMVFTDTKLIHLALGDCYSITPAHARGLTKADIVAEVRKVEAHASLFGRPKTPEFPTKTAS